MNQKTSLSNLLTHFLLVLFGLFMVYPLIWMFFASFKTTNEIFVSPNLLPEIFLWENYRNGWQSAATGAVSYTNFFINTLFLVVPTVIFTVLSSLLVAYGFTRFRFPGSKILFSLMIATLMLPNSVIVIPRFMIFKNLGWLDSYLPFIVPAMFACYPFFIFMLVQFMRGIPIALDESAKIDGCGPWRILFSILAPLMKPALFSAGLFQFLWTWNDFFNQLIFINSPKKYTIALGLRMSIDSSTQMVRWNEVMAMSLCSILPLILLFFFAQRYFVEGISTSGIKG